MTARNIEIKCSIRSLDTARQVAQQVATQSLGVQRQVDTYFHCRNGRLKLREIEGQPAQLVSYLRPDLPGPKASDYTLAPVADAGLLKQALAAALGIWRVVDKRREIWLTDNVRIHLDDVVGLGSFLEFEAVLKPPFDNEAGQRQVDALMAQFGVTNSDLTPGSYSDLLESAAP